MSVRKQYIVHRVLLQAVRAVQAVQVVRAAAEAAAEAEEARLSDIMENFDYKDFTLQWHITHRCNLRCKHCYQDDYSAFQDMKDIENVLDQYCTLLKEYNCLGRLNITGGEPLTHPHLFEILRLAHSKGIKTGVLTNGTLIGEWDARKLKACHVDYVQISLDGMEKVHDSIRGKGSFRKAVNGIYALKSQGIFTSISFTAQNTNLSELKKLAVFCYFLGVDKLWFDRVIIPVDEDENNLTVSSKDFQKLCRTAAHFNKLNMVFCGRALQFIPCRNKLIYHCSAGENLLIVLANGDVMPCRRLPFVIGNIKQTDLLDLHQNSPVMRKLRNTGIPESCKDCKYSKLCRGGSKCVAYAKMKRFDIPDPDCKFRKISEAPE